MMDMKNRFAVALVLGLAMLPGTEAVEAQAIARPIPTAVVPPASHQRAVERGWRSEDGSPGHAYWQQWESYDIRAELDPETSRLTGSVQILYAHDAPANLPAVFVHLHQNIHKAGSPRYSQQEVTEGVTITRLAADGEELSEGPAEDGPGWEVNGTVMQVRPSIRLEPGDTLQLDIDWEVELPQHGAGRMGHSDNEVFFVAYWFPKMAVFDNLAGWNAQPYLGNAEFYGEFGDYQVELTVPTGWSVMATGELENPDEVYSAITVRRLSEAAVSDTLVVIADRASRDAGTVTAEGVDGKLTYRFSAEQMRDFAWTASNTQLWNATSAVVAVRPPTADDEDGEGGEEEDEGSAAGTVAMDVSAETPAERRVLIHSFYREDRAPLWADQWEYAKQSIEFHSRYTDLPYPWPHMTSVEGDDIIEGGMEFPMMTVMGPYDGQEPTALFNTTSHEIAHMWVPMIVGTDEKRHAWMDEGISSFLENESRMEYWPGVDHHRVQARTYLQVAAAGQEQSMMRHGDYYEPGPGYGVASYPKPAALLQALKTLLGESTFEAAMQAFFDEWSFKHPDPWDFFNTIERFAEEDLDWFWTSYYYNTWTLDHAVGSVQPKPGGGAIVTISDRSAAVFPTNVRVRTTNGMDFVHEIPVEHWLAGNTTYEIDIAATAGTVRRVEIDPEGNAPDIDRANNIWPQGR